MAINTEGAVAGAVAEVMVGEIMEVAEVAEDEVEEVEEVESVSEESGVANSVNLRN